MKLLLKLNLYLKFSYIMKHIKLNIVWGYYA